jgi:hypothetical protein
VDDGFPKQPLKSPWESGALPREGVEVDMPVGKVKIVKPPPAPPPPPKLPGQYMAMSKDMAKSGGRNILLWMIALVVLWWTIELYAINTKKTLEAARTELDRANQTVGQLAKAQRELNAKVGKHEASKKTGKRADRLTEEQLAEAKAALKALGDDMTKAVPRLETANLTFEHASQPDFIDFKPPVPGSEMFRLPYSVAPIVWASLLLGVIVYVCMIRWRVFEFALRSFHTPLGANMPAALDDTLAPAAWWMFPVPLVDASADKHHLRHLFGVSTRQKDQYPFLLCVGIAALLALHFRVNQLSQDIHALVNPAQFAIAKGKDVGIYAQVGDDARRMDNSPEALAPILSQGLLALNLSLVLWWLWPRALRSHPVPQLEQVITRRMALGSSVAIGLGLAGGVLTHTRKVGDNVAASMQRTLSRLHLIRNPRYRRKTSRHTQVSWDDGLYLNPASGVIHVVSNGLLLGVSRFKANRPEHKATAKPTNLQAFVPLAVEEAIKRIGSSISRPPSTVEAIARLNKSAQIRLNGSTSSFLAELSVSGQFPLQNDHEILTVLMACIKRDLQVKENGEDRVRTGKRKKLRRRNQERLVATSSTPKMPAHAASGQLQAVGPLRVSFRLYDQLQRIAERIVNDKNVTEESEKRRATEALRNMKALLKKHSLIELFERYRGNRREWSKLRQSSRMHQGPVGPWVRPFKG